MYCAHSASDSCSDFSGGGSGSAVKGTTGLTYLRFGRRPGGGAAGFAFSHPMVRGAVLRADISGEMLRVLKHQLLPTCRV